MKKKERSIRVMTLKQIGSAATSKLIALSTLLYFFKNGPESSYQSALTCVYSCYTVEEHLKEILSHLDDKA